MRLALVGAGLTHLEVLRRWSECVELQQVECVALNPVAQELQLSTAGALHYDYVSFDLGSQNRSSPFYQVTNNEKRLLKLGVGLVEGLVAWDELLAAKPAAEMAVIGSSPAAIEMAFALRKRYAQSKLTVSELV